MTTLYTKVGRRYVPTLDAQRWEMDTMRVGTWRMAYAHAAGGKRYEYDVTPDTASFVAAAMLAGSAMSDAIRAAAVHAPDLGKVSRYTKRQMTLIERFRADMAATGGFVPAFWHHASADEIAQAGIAAVRAYAHGQPRCQSDFPQAHNVVSEPEPRPKGL